MFNSLTSLLFTCLMWRWPPPNSCLLCARLVLERERERANGREDSMRERERERLEWNREREREREILRDWEGASLKVNAEIGDIAVGGGQTNFEHSLQWSYYPSSLEVTAKAAGKAPQTGKTPTYWTHRAQYEPLLIPQTIKKMFFRYRWKNG